MSTLNENSTISIYYLFRCDDKNRPTNMQSDESFNLNEHKEVYKLKSELDKKGINYDLLIERFDTDCDEVLSNDYIVSKNYLNN